MSLITTPSTVLSILKLDRTPSEGFLLPPNIRRIFLNFLTNTSTAEYHRLVNSMREADITDNELMTLLKNAKECLPMLNYDLRLFVQALTLINWPQRDENIVKMYQSFFCDLVSIHSQHIKVIVDQLIKLYSIIEDYEWAGLEPVEDVKRQFLNIHETLSSIPLKVPLSEELLMARISSNFPHPNSREPQCRHMAYLYNILQYTYYQPSLRAHILETALDKLLTRDVLSTREDILQTKEEVMEDIENPQSRQLKQVNIEILDAQMEIIMIYIRNVCYDENNRLLKKHCFKLFKELVRTFGKIILPVKCHHIQFVIFYLCSFDKMLVLSFLKYLWTRATSPSVPSLIRQNCISYLTGLLAHGRYVLLGYVKIYLSKMANWVNKYISGYCDTCATERVDNTVFYAMCNAIFYLVTYRHEDLVDSCSTVTFLQGLNLQKVVTSCLNPLRACPSELARQFAAIAYGHQLAYCFTIIENNARDNLPLMDIWGNKKTRAMKMYFPFGSTLLPRTSSYVAKIYRQLKHPALIRNLGGSEVRKLETQCSICLAHQDSSRVTSTSEK